MTNLERAPRPGTDSAKVYPYLKEGKNRYEIAQATGLKGDNLSFAIAHNYRMRYVVAPVLDQQERRKMHRENTSAAKGGIWLAIRPYEPLLFTARQTQIVLEHFDEKFLTFNQVTTAYQRLRARHGSSRPSHELFIEARRDRDRSREEILKIVRLRLKVRDLLKQNNIVLPITLVEWETL